MEHGHGLHVADISELLRIVGSRAGDALQHLAPPVPGGQHERIVDGLRPRPAAGLRHDQADHICDLRLRGNADAVRVLEERDQEQAHHDGVFQRVRTFHQRRRRGPPLYLFHFRPDIVVIFPDIPLIKGYFDVPR